MNSKKIMDTRAYVDLLKSYRPDSEISLYATGGTLLWLNDNTPNVPRSLDLSGWQRDIGELCWHTEGDRQRFAWPVTDEQDLVSHYLVVSSVSGPGDREKLYADMLPVLNAIAASMSKQLYLNSELDSMARELAVRYEELNLVYFTDDEVRHLDEGRQALHGLVQNCNEYLNVDMTALLMPDQGMSIVRHGTDNHGKTEPFPMSLQDNLLSTLESEPKTIVFNEPAESQRILGVSVKIIASPILDGNGAVSGLLVIIRSPNATDFSNSDRNLLMVMSGKASKIVQSSYDTLTGLMRQEGFERSLSSALHRATNGDFRHMLLHINIDRMHVVNDTLGYQAGDKVIQTVARLLRDRLRETDRIARLAGDEFGILLQSCTVKQGELVAEKLCTAISDLKIDYGTQVVDVTACIGVASLDKDSASTINAQAGAEIACSVAKERGRDRWHVYDKDDPSLQARQEQMEWIGQLKEALRDDKFRLFSQRIMPLNTKTAGHHFEILIRMVDDDNNIVSPAMFLPVAERYQMMPEIDRWVVEHTLSRLAEHRDEMARQQIVCAINLSGQTLVEPNFSEFVTEQFEKNGVAPSMVCFEVTETAAIANLADAQRLIHSLKSLGCGFALDDFGAGLSSFAYLRSLPVDYLKLDGSFVKPIAEDDVAAAMLAAMNQIGKIVGLRTIAEFVESQAIIDQLIDMGVDYGQGYGISKPRPLAEEFDEISRVAISV